MFSTLADAQNKLVNAVLDVVEDEPDWRRAFLHAEFAGSGDMLRSIVESFIVRNPPDPRQRDPLMLAASALDAIEELHAAYTAAGQGFARLDLTIEAPDGRYRFEFGNDPSLRLAGEADPAAAAYLDKRYAELSRS